MMNKSREHIPPTCVDTSDSVLSIFIIKFSLNVSMDSSLLLVDLMNDLFTLGYAYFCGFFNDLLILNRL